MRSLPPYPPRDDAQDDDGEAPVTGSGLGRYGGILRSPRRGPEVPDALLGAVGALQVSTAAVKVWQYVRAAAGGLDQPVALTTVEVADALQVTPEKVRRWRTSLIDAGFLSLSAVSGAASVDAALDAGLVLWEVHDGEPVPIPPFPG